MKINKIIIMIIISISIIMNNSIIFSQTPTENKQIDISEDLVPEKISKQNDSRFSISYDPVPTLSFMLLRILLISTEEELALTRYLSVNIETSFLYTGRVGALLIAPGMRYYIERQGISQLYLGFYYQTPLIISTENLNQYDFFDDIIINTNFKNVTLVDPRYMIVKGIGGYRWDYSKWFVDFSLGLSVIILNDFDYPIPAPTANIGVGIYL